MQTIVTAQQINHFTQFGWIEFEQFLSIEECDAIQAAITETLAIRLGIPPVKLSRRSEKELYFHGRDCWRSSIYLKQFFCAKRCAAILGSLTNKQMMLLACDQWIPPKTVLEPLHLNDHFSFQNLIGGCLLHLEGNGAGNARFFHPDRFPLINESQMLIAYSQINCVYIHNPNDPNNAHLKQFNYSFGDRINTDTHPLCKGH